MMSHHCICVVKLLFSGWEIIRSFFCESWYSSQVTFKPTVTCNCNGCFTRQCEGLFTDGVVVCRWSCSIWEIFRRCYGKMEGVRRKGAKGRRWKEKRKCSYCMVRTLMFPGWTLLISMVSRLGSKWVHWHFSDVPKWINLLSCQMSVCRMYLGHNCLVEEKQAEFQTHLATTVS